MATLTAEQLDELRQGMQQDGHFGDWTKADVNAACQAIEDQWESVQVALSAAIDTATSPVVFTNAQKKSIGKYWLKQRFGRGG